MRIRRNRLHRAHIEAGALSDLLFFLLIFFLLIASLSASNMMKLKLPKSSSVVKAKKEIIHLYVSEKGEYILDKRRVSDLRAALLSRKKPGKEQSVMINIERTSSVQDLVGVVDIVNDVKMSPVLATHKK